MYSCMISYDCCVSQMMNDSMEGLDCLDDKAFYEMKQLTSPMCEISEMIDFFHEPPSLSLPRSHHQQNFEYLPQLEYSPLSCKVEDTLLFDFPHPSPSAEVSHHLQMPSEAAAGGQPLSTFPAHQLDSAPVAAGCRSGHSAGDIAEAKRARRGRKRLPETVCTLHCSQ